MMMASATIGRNCLRRGFLSVALLIAVAAIVIRLSTRGTADSEKPILPSATPFDPQEPQSLTVAMPTSPYPDGKTFLDTLKRSFAHVKVDASNDNAINTTEFLEASESLTTLFDILGSVAFSPVKNDMLGNVKKIRDRQLVAPLESENLQSLVRNELKAKKHVATEGLLWLVRGLEFTSLAISQNLAAPDDELSTSFRAAYGFTLKPHHGFLVKPVFSAAMGACPYRKNFYSSLGNDQAQVATELKKWLAALESQVAILKPFLDKDGKW